MIRRCGVPVVSKTHINYTALCIKDLETFALHFKGKSTWYRKKFSHLWELSCLQS